MKKAKSLLAVAAVATAITCAVGMTACNKSGNTTENPKNDSQIAAVYQLYSANAQANGETALTYEQWLESIKGPQGATGATGATGKSAYEIAKENGFEGTEAEWLASLKGADGINGTNGTNGTNGKSAYEIAQDNGFTGTEAEWLASLKGEKGEDGSASTSPCVEGIYNTSDGLVVKFTDGTVKPVQNGGVTNQLLVVGENEIEVGTEITTAFTYAPVTIVSFYTLTGGTYKFTLYDPNISLYEGTVDGASIPFVDIENLGTMSESFDFGTNADGSFYSCLKFDKNYSFFIANWGSTATTVRLTIERVA